MHFNALPSSRHTARKADGASEAESATQMRPSAATGSLANLLYPFENYTLGASNKPFFFDGKAPFFGCIESITLQPFDFKALVPVANWVAPIPALTKFTPGHGARIEVTDDNQNPNSVDVQIEFSDLMDCDSVSKAITFKDPQSLDDGH